MVGLRPCIFVSARVLTADISGPSAMNRGSGFSCSPICSPDVLLRGSVCSYARVPPQPPVHGAVNCDQLLKSQGSEIGNIEKSILVSTKNPRFPVRTQSQHHLP
jgi:hypothetical protein